MVETSTTTDATNIASKPVASDAPNADEENKTSAEQSQ